MACVAITLYAKAGIAIMATAAGRTAFHLRHGETFVFRSGIIKFVMTIRTGIHGQMFVVIEAGIIREKDLFERVTLAAGFDAESCFAVMACAT